MTDNTCNNCKYSNTIEVFDPVWASYYQTEIIRKCKEESGVDLTKTLQMKCHYAGQPQPVHKSDWCHQWSAKDT